MIRFNNQNDRWGWYSYIESGDLVIGESTPHEGGVLYRGEYKGDDTPYLLSLKADDVRQYNKIVKYFKEKDNTDKLINELLEKGKQKFIKEHTPIISTNYNNTYIIFEKYDHYSEVIINKIERLLDLMEIGYSISVIKLNEEFFLFINGDDANRNLFIQKFIDNGYKLSW